MQELEAQQAELQTTENRYSEVKMWLDSFAEHIQSGDIMNADGSMIMKQLVEQIIVGDDGIEGCENLLASLRQPTAQHHRIGRPQHGELHGNLQLGDQFLHLLIFLHLGRLMPSSSFDLSVQRRATVSSSENWWLTTFLRVPTSARCRHAWNTPSLPKARASCPSSSP